MRLIQNGFGNNFGLVGKNLRRYLTTTALTATSIAAFASPSFADNWTDHVATEGTISIDTSAANTTNITQGTDFVKVNGDGDINAGWTVNLAQPSSSSKYVLYDIENDPTEIMGALNANGQVFIFDQNGVIFGAGSQVNVGSIIASTGNISDVNIKSNQHVFENVGGAGSIQLKGTVSVADAGLAAFVAPTVANSGVINAKMGTVALASGNTVTLDLYGDNLVEIAIDGALENALVENSGTINANGGRVVLAAQAAKNAVDSVINMDGIIDVSSVSTKGGKIVLSGGNKGVVNVSGNLKADGETGGGTIEVTGQNVSVVATGELTSDAGLNGNGGSITVFGKDFAIFSGRVSARGGSESGNGGNAEISGGESVGYYGFTDLSAANGDTGTLLIDPRYLTLTNVDGGLVDIGLLLADYASGGTSSLINIYDKALAKTLYYANVNLWATESITTLTDVDVSTANVKTGTTTSYAGICGFFGGCTVDVFENRITGNDLILSAPTVNLLHDIILGNGGLKIYDIAAGVQPAGWDGLTNTILPSPFAIAVETLNLNGRIKARSTVNGAVTDAALNKLDGQAHTVNVLSDNASINQGIRFADGTLPGLATVRVLPGVYNESVLVDKSIKLLGTFAGVNPILRLLVPEAIETVIDPNSPGIHVTADNVVVDGFVITGATGSDGYGVWVDGADNATVQNNIIHGNESHGVLLNNGSTNGHVLSNRIYDLGVAIDSANGIFADGVGNGFVAEGNIIDDIKGNGIYIKSSNGPINVKTNFIGTLASSAGVDGIWGDGIEIEDVNGNTFVQSNIITNTWDETDDNTNDDSSGIYLKRSSNIVVGGPGLLDGNLITNVDWDGVKLAGGTGNLVQGNIISDTTRVGIYGEGTNNATVTLNSVSNANLANAGAITLRDGDDHTISYNFVTGATSGADAGIMLHVGAGGDNLITGNILHDINGRGIEVFNVSDADITLNSISKTKGDAIYLHDSYGDFNIAGNIINDIKGNGIYVKLVGGLTNVKANLIGLLASDAETNGIWGDGIEIEDVNGNTFVQSNIITNTWDPTKNNTNDNSSGIYLKRSSNIVVGGGLLEGNLIYNVDWDGVKVAGGTGNLVQGNIIDDTTRIGIYGEGTNNATVTLNSVSNANLANAGAITLRDGDDHTISYNFVTGPTSGADAGIMLHVGAGGDNLIQGNIVHDIKGTGIEVFNVSDVDIKFNSVTKTQGHGIYLHDSYGDMNIIGNEVDNTRGNGIYVKLVGGLTNVKANLIGLFSSNPAVDGIWGDGIEIEDVNGNTFVQSNIISNTWDPTKDNTNDNSSGIYLKRSSNIVVGGPGLLDGNLITNADWDGIKVAGGTGNIIDGNIVHHSTRIGIYGEGTNDATVINNLVHDSNLATWGGITLLDGDSHYVNNNVVWNEASSTGWHGIYLERNGDNNEVSDNWVYDVSHDGIHVQETTGTFEIDNNKIGTVDNGIWARDVQGLTITDNLIDGRFLESGKGTFGIYVEDSDYAKIGGGLFSDTNYVEDFKTGIRIVSSEVAEVLGNVVNAFVDNGIHVTDSIFAKINKNIVGNGTGNGILVADSDYAEISENGVALVGGNGIQLVDSDYASIYGNLVSLVGGIGIFVDPSDYVEIIDNWVHFTGDDGIRLDYGTSGYIYGNHVGFTGGDGIEVYDNIATIGGNIVHHTADNGILVTDTALTFITDNDVYHTGKNGIFVNDVANANVTQNRVKKSGWDGIHVSHFDEAYIVSNNVSKSGDDGIEAHDGHIVEIDSNTVSKSGWGNWWDESYDEFFGGHDGISVRNIYGAYVESEDDSEYDKVVYEGGYEPGIVRITNNGVGAGDDEVDDEEFEASAKSVSGTDGGVSRSGDDGIEVVNVQGYVYIVGNSVEHSGVGSSGIPYGQADEYGADGIHVRDVALAYYDIDNHYREGDIGNGEYNIVVAGNDVNNSLDDGIEILGRGGEYSDSFAKVYEGDYEELDEKGNHFEGTYGEYEGDYYTKGSTGRVLVSGNTVNNSGWGNPGYGYGQSDAYYSGGDGIHVEGIYANYYAAGVSESGEFSGYAVDILGNTVNNSGDDGIDVEWSSSTLIDKNTVTNSGWVGEGDEEGDEAFAKISKGGSGADEWGADGIFVNNVGGGYYNVPKVYALESEYEGPGDGYQEYSVVIRRNTVDNSLDDGIQVNNNMYEKEVAPVLVEINENVSNSGNHGLYISGPTHGNVIVRGNNFAGFDIGGEFESGLIDLSQEGNTWTNGRIGLKFAPYLLGYDYGDDEGDEPVPYFAYLDLVDDDLPGSTPWPTPPGNNFGGTIGKQIFTGFKEEGDFYVYLDDYALTNEGTPIWLNGLNSTYDDITPSDTAGVLTQEQFDFLEARFRHFPDAGAETADIFWFGFVPSADINQSLIFNRFGAFNGDVTGLNVRILGLPNTGTQGPSGTNFNNIQTFAGNTNNPADLNEIETAAGGDDTTNPQNLSEIETEAGGENESCWSAAANAASAGQAVNVVYGGSFSDNLDQAAACGTSF